MSSCKYLVIFFAVSAGQNGPNLGADEEEIVLIVYLILDVENNKVSYEVVLAHTKLSSRSGMLHYP